jgi:hypothetical protein
MVINVNRYILINLFEKSILNHLFSKILLLSALSLSFECEGQVTIYDLKKLPEHTALKLSDLGVSDIQYIPLETTEKSVIPAIQKIIRGKNYFLTHSYTNINMFRNDGSYITKIGIVGRGPNEYTSAHDVEINPKDETIYLIDGVQKKFLVYSNNGEFIRTFNYPKFPNHSTVNFGFTDDGILCYNANNMGDTETSFILMDTNGKIIKSFPNKYSWVRSSPTLAFQHENIFYRYNNHLIKKEIYSDTLYVFNNKNFEPYSIINIGKLRITPEVRTKSDVKFISQNFINPVNLFEFDNYIYYEFLFPRDDKFEILAFMGSKNGKLRVIFDPQKELINDIDGGPSIRPRTIWDDKTMITWIDAITLKTFVTSEKFKNYNPIYPEKKEKLISFANKIKETDNPILILVKLK